jgi:serine/threonine-protein kinase
MDSTSPASITTTSTGCAGTGGYSDMQLGAVVTVRDGSDKVIATGRIVTSEPLGTHQCHFTFRVSDVPDADFYQVEVSHRGALTFSRTEMDAQGWALALTLGK